jgi:hypothetical protein
MRTNLPVVVLVSALILTPLRAHAVTYIDDNFDSETIGATPTNATLKAVSQVKIAAGTGVIGTDNVARYNDTLSGSAGYLEYNANATSNTVGNMYIQFDLLNNAPVATGANLNPVIFGIGPWSSSTSQKLNANANRSVGLEFYQTGSNATLIVRTNGNQVVNTTYDMLALQTVKMWANDNDSTGIAYIRPDTLATATLGANSFVVYINDVLMTNFTDSGVAMSTIGVGSTVGNTTLGRVGFDSTSATVNDFFIDNLLVTDIPVIPEPSTSVLVLGGAGLLGWCLRRANNSRKRAG